MVKKILFILSFVISCVNSFALEDTQEVNCNNYGWIAQDCNQCFDGGHVYKWRAKELWDAFVNNTNNDYAYFSWQNKNVVNIKVYNNTNWFITNRLVKYPDSFIWYKLWSHYYHVFKANTVEDNFLVPVNWWWVRLDGIGNNTDREKPAIKIKFIANYRLLKNWKLNPPKITHTECIFYKPAWCGDGVIDTNQWEECDPKAPWYNSSNCSNSCQKITPKTYDLALKKVVVNPKNTYLPGDSIKFAITVYNQWQLDAKNIKIVDYLQNVFQLNDSNWTLNGNKAYYTISDTIKAWKTKTIYITLKIKTWTKVGNYVNWTEIAQDNGDDVDSTPDSDWANDCHGWDGPNGGTPNVIDKNLDNFLNWKWDQDKDGVCEEWEDEDDHDPALIQVGSYDLALKKTIKNPKSEYNIWDNVVFNITVYDQWTIDAKNINIVDYIPTGLQINDSSWTYNSTTKKAYKSISEIKAWENKTITITMKVVWANGWKDIVNAAEIAQDNGNDCDSTPDDTNWNTQWEKDGTLIDDDIGNGCNPWWDEDDHDIAKIKVKSIFDLALTKEVKNPKSTYKVWDVVEYKIEAVNQWNVDGKDIKITDYIPSNMELTGSNGWTVNGNKATYNLWLLPWWNKKDITIKLKIKSGSSGDVITNWAEISQAKNDLNLEDCDSTPDNINGNTTWEKAWNVVDHSSTNPNPTGCNKWWDEDDHDPAKITLGNVDIFDLALTKEVKNPKSTYKVWEVVEYKIEAVNQWNVDGKDIKITDYIPSNMELTGSNGWTVNGNKATYNLWLLPWWNKKDITIKLKIKSGSSGDVITNWAEISQAKNDLNLEDCDSTPDNINGNTTWEKAWNVVDHSSTNPNPTGCNKWWDEDDHDPAKITLGNVEQPTCGSANGKKYPASTSTWPSSDTFCSKWTPDPANPSFPSQWWSTSWKCKLNGQETTCSARRWTSRWWGGGWGWYRRPTTYCGDDIVQNPNSAWINEECDNGRYNWNVNKVVKTDGNKKYYCSTSCKLVEIKVPCAVNGPCPGWTCGVLNGKTLTRSQYGTLVKYVNQLTKPEYRQKFCAWANDVLSFSVNTTLGGSEFARYCGTTKCSMSLNETNGFIKVYGAYKNAWSCPECLGFDTETDNYIRRKFLTNYDTGYTRSIMQGDYLPIWFTLQNYKQYTWSGCKVETEWKYDASSFNVKFTVDNIDKSFVVQALKAFPDQSVMWQAYLPANDTKSLSLGEHIIRWYVTKVKECKCTDADGDGNITDSECNWQDKTVNQNFASVKFTVTKPYMIQLNPMSTASSLLPRFNWASPSIPNVETSSVSDTKLKDAISKFVAKYKAYATQNVNVPLFVDRTLSWKKVPTKNIYYIDLSTQREGWKYVKIWWDVNQPTTVIVENGKVVIEWDIKWPLMLVVKNGDIEINNENMNRRTIMEGYYFTDKEFKVVWPAVTHSSILNQDPNSVIWYADGRLAVRWVLIWSGANTVYEKRRSVLKNWFRTGYGPEKAVLYGASLTIIPDSNLLANPPEWSKDLFEMLQIKKWN